MAYIIKNSNDSNYARADFISALGGLQPRLESGKNIKTINGNSVLGAGNIDVSQKEYIYDLTQVEQGLQSNALSKLNSINPGHKYMAFGFLTDLHESYNDIPYTGGDSNVIITSKHELRLMGSIAHTYGLDAVLFGGDYSLGKDLTYQQYNAALDELLTDVNTNISVPRYATEGNHDRWYNTDVQCRGNAEWLAFLKRFNSSGAVYIDNQDAVNGNGVKPYAGEVGNTYYIDFPAYKVRVIMKSQYERQELNGSPSAVGAGFFAKNYHDAMQFENPSDALEWTIVSVSHYTTSWANTYLNHYFNGTAQGKGANSDQFVFSPCNGGNKGKAVVGEIYGHVHSQASHAISENNELISLSVWNSFAPKDGDYQNDDYHFSIFVIDTDHWMLHEIKVGLLYDTTDNAYYNSSTGVFSYPIRHN